MVERVNRATRDGQRAHRAARARRAARPNFAPRPGRGPELDLFVDLAKLALNIANCSIGSYVSLVQPHHLLRLLVLHSRTLEGERVAVAAIGIGSLLVQPWQRSPQFSASLF
jgi:hypothetical protein